MSVVLRNAVLANAMTLKEVMLLGERLSRVRSVLLFWALWSLTGCEGELHAQYPVIDSKFSVTDQPLYWLDNERVIFYGYEGDKPATVEAQKALRFGIFIWNTQTGAVDKVSESTGGLCYFDGHLYYHIKQRRQPTEEGVEEYLEWAEGPFGQEVRQARTYFWPFKDKKKPSDWEWNKLTCQRVERPPALQGHYWVPLLPGHGYLDGGDASMSDAHLSPVFLHHPDGRISELDMQRRDLITLNWYAFKKQYLSWAAVNRGWDVWEASNCEPVHWITVQGEVSKECLPYGPWAGGAGIILSATATGYIVISHAMKSSTRPGTGGAYLVRQDHGVKLIDGLVRSPAVSPSGCKVAFAHAPNIEALRIGAKGRRTLKMIDVCVDE